MDINDEYETLNIYKENPLISIIIPIYNVEQYLKECVISVCQQTYGNLEIILVNDGSTDNSGNICKELAIKDCRIIIINKENGGLSSARNTGIDIAKGDFLFFLDGDDFIEKDTLELLLKGFESDANIGIVSAPCFLRYNNGHKTIYREDWNIKENRLICPKDFRNIILTQRSSHSACCKLYAKCLLEKIRFRKGKRNEDTLFMFDLSFVIEENKVTMVEIPNRLYYYRVNNVSITQNMHQPIQIDILENLKEIIREIPETNIRKILNKIYNKEFVNFYAFLTINSNLYKCISPIYLERFNILIGQTTEYEIFKYSSLKDIVKFLIIKYLTPFYLYFNKMKNDLF